MGKLDRKAFVASLTKVLRKAGAADDTEVTAAADEFVARAEGRFAGIQVDEKAFAEHVATLSFERGAAETLRALHAEDLLLAFACAMDDKRAMTYFNDVFMPEVAQFVAHLDRSPAFADEVKQGLREKLLVAREEGGRRKILEYTGRGPLGAWLRVASVRTGLNLKRGKKAAPTADIDDQHGVGARLRSSGPDPEMDYLKTKYRKEFKEAFQATLSSLDQDQRNVLRMHYIDGLNIDEIGAAYRVHRSTVARWLAHAREQILAETKKRMSAKLKLSATEVDSLMVVIQSQLEVSLHKYLKKK